MRSMRTRSIFLAILFIQILMTVYIYKIYTRFTISDFSINAVLTRENSVEILLQSSDKFNKWKSATSAEEKRKEVRAHINKDEEEHLNQANGEETVEKEKNEIKNIGFKTNRIYDIGGNNAGKVGKKLYNISKNERADTESKTFLSTDTTQIGNEVWKLNKNSSYKTAKTVSSERESSSNFSTLEDVYLTMRKQIESLQEEGDCESKKILYCENRDNIAGLGSMIHRYGVCMQVAYGLGRTWFIKQVAYDQFGGLAKWLKPESKKCGYLKEKYYKHVKKCNIQKANCYEPNGYEVNNSYKVMIYHSELAFPHPRHIPTTLPYEIETALLKFNVSNPWLWFTSQFLGYLLLRPNEYLLTKIRTISNTTGLTHPYVAMHIRRGDKVSSGEAKLTDETVYLQAAEAYFNKHLPNASNKDIYLASDQHNMKRTLERKNSSNNYNILTPPSVGNSGRLHTVHAIESMLIDLYFLIYSNYTICTFSSNIGRMVYELKQTIPPYNAIDRVISVDFPSQVDYMWFGYMSWFFYLYHVTTSGNSRGRNIEEHSVLNYKSGQLVEFTNVTYAFKENGTEVVLCYIRTKYRKRHTTDIEGYVFKEHITKWPGNPKYYFYP